MMNLRLGTDFIASMITGSIIGYWIDRWFATSPFFLILFIILGFAAGCRTLMRASSAQQKSSPSKGDAPDA